MSMVFGNMDVSAIDSLVIGSILTIVVGIGCTIWGILYAKKSENKKKKAETKLLEVARKYVLRTILINLKVIYEGGDDRMAYTEDNRKKFVKLLDTYYDDYQDASINEIRTLVKHELHPNDKSSSCDCNKIVETIINFLNDPRNKNVDHPYVTKKKTP